MIAWMTWATLVSFLVGYAALFLEGVLRSRGRPARWAWCSALSVTVGLIGWSAFASADREPSTIMNVIPGEFAQVWWTGAQNVAAREAVQSVDPFVAGVWIAASSVLLLGLVGGVWRLRRRAAAWPMRQVGDHEVLLSDDFGPALVGFRQPRIVIPKPLLSRPVDDLAVVCLHEAQHREARDTWLLAGSALAAVALPWNVAVWWQVIRLRAAVEIDCDGRVLSAGVAPLAYASVLLSVGTRGEQLGLVAPAFVTPPPLLERRRTMVVQGLKRRSTASTLAALAVSALLVFVACDTPAPAGPAAPTRPVFTTLNAQLGNGVGAPLIFVDGAEVDWGPTPLREFDRIAREDVESVEIIKAPWSLDTYGPRAAGGVIRITLKAR